MRIAFYISIVILAAACRNSDDLFKSYGPETTEIRNVGSFNMINVGEKFDVILVQDSSKDGMVEITAGGNVIDGYKTEVRNSELHIFNDNKFNWVRKLKVRQKVVVYFKTMNNIQISGSAKFSCRDSIVNADKINISHGGLEDADLKIKGDYIFVDCTNTGGVNLIGKCFLLSASVDDISFINSKGLKAEKCYLNSFSKDDSYVEGEDVMEIKLYGTGNIYYKTPPSAAVSILEKGSGKVLKLN